MSYHGNAVEIGPIIAAKSGRRGYQSCRVILLTSSMKLKSKPAPGFSVFIREGGFDFLNLILPFLFNLLSLLNISISSQISFVLCMFVEISIRFIAHVGLLDFEAHVSQLC